jgi:hypothetical protein
MMRGPPRCVGACPDWGRDGHGEGVQLGSLGALCARKVRHNGWPLLVSGERGQATGGRRWAGPCAFMQGMIKVMIE